MRNLVPGQRLKRITLKLGEFTNFKGLFLVVSGNSSELVQHSDLLMPVPGTDSHANDFVNAKSYAREKRLLAGYGRNLITITTTASQSL